MVAVYPRPLVLQPSLPTYVCSFASPDAASASTSVMPCIPSSTMIGSPVPNVVWSPRSTDVVTVVTQRTGLNSSTSQSGNELTVLGGHGIPSVSRSRTCSGHYSGQPKPSFQPVSTSASSGGSQQPTDCSLPTSVEDLASRLVSSLPTDVVKSLLDSDSSLQTVEMLLDTLNVMKTSDGNVLDTDVVQKLSNCPQLVSMVEELASSKFEAKMTRWRSLPGLLQQTENKAAAFTGGQDYLESAVDEPSCQGVVRSLGQLGQAPAYRLEDKASNLY